MSHRVCNRNVERDALLSEIAVMKQGTPAIWKDIIAKKEVEVAKRTRRPTEVCQLCKHVRYDVKDAQCHCAPSLDKNKVPRVVGLTNRHMLRSQMRVYARIMKKWYRYCARGMSATPISTKKFSEEAAAVQTPVPEVACL
jgi:hypothetical protein